MRVYVNRPVPLRYTLALDKRPACRDSGPIVDAGGPVWCHLPKGHEGRHEWATPLTGRTEIKWR